MSGQMLALAMVWDIVEAFLAAEFNPSLRHSRLSAKVTELGMLNAETHSRKAWMPMQVIGQSDAAHGRSTAAKEALTYEPCNGYEYHWRE